MFMLPTLHYIPFSKQGKVSRNFMGIYFQGKKNKNIITISYNKCYLLTCYLAKKLDIIIITTRSSLVKIDHIVTNFP
jgi:hypothetical protein